MKAVISLDIHQTISVKNLSKASFVRTRPLRRRTALRSSVHILTAHYQLRQIIDPNSRK